MKMSVNEKEMVLLSIVVPVYNVEKYLDRCVNSLLNQDLDEYEILLIDDGSTDSSGNICDRLALDSSKISVIHKSNGGLSDARNVGLLHAKGDYIMFVDSDDALMPSKCKTLYNIAHSNELDVLSFAVNWIEDGNSRIRNSLNVEPNVVYTGKRFLSKELSSGKFMAMAQKRLYSRTFLLKHELFFKKGIFHEDEQWSPRVLLSSKRIMQIDDNVYNYYIRGGSITTSATNVIRRSEHLVNTIEELYDLYIKEEDTLKLAGLSYIANLYMSSISKAKIAGTSLKWHYKYIKGYKNGYKALLRKCLFVTSPWLYGKVLISR